MTKPIDYLLSPQAVRESCQKVLARSLDGEGQFDVHLDRLEPLADLVVDVCRNNYPDGKIPFHSRLRHFTVGGIHRLDILDKTHPEPDPIERARRLVDLVVVSVLLDAGAGMAWRYHEESSGQEFSRSEGLAVASFHMFSQGLFSMNYKAEVSAEALLRLPLDSLAHGFQVSDKNPITGLSGRLTLLNNLGKTLKQEAKYFPGARPGGLVDYFLKEHHGRLNASTLLKSVLKGFGDIWPGRHSWEGHSLGDAWPHPILAKENGEHRYVVFHKLSQWLSYSLIEALAEAGIVVSDVDQLTGLAEYRNGGLFLDGGAITLKDQNQAKQAHALDSPLIVEWRALTVALLDRIAPLVRSRLGKSDMPLVSILEGGTWWAGRRLASKARSDGGPPLKLDSDGTIF